MNQVWVPLLTCINGFLHFFFITLFVWACLYNINNKAVWEKHLSVLPLKSLFSTLLLSWSRMKAYFCMYQSKQILPRFLTYSGYYLNILKSKLKIIKSFLSPKERLLGLHPTPYFCISVDFYTQLGKESSSFKGWSTSCCTLCPL